jgi:hypothetical protein
VSDQFDFFPRTRYWRPTEAWERAWRRNLARAPRRRSPEESQLIKDKVCEWRELAPNEKPTLEDLRKQFEPPVTKQYLSRRAHSLPPRIMLPPIRRASTPLQRIELTGTVPVRPVLEGHGWNCECSGCEMEAVIKAAQYRTGDHLAWGTILLLLAQTCNPRPGSGSCQ